MSEVFLEELKIRALNLHLEAGGEGTNVLDVCVCQPRSLANRTADRLRYSASASGDMIGSAQAE